MNSPAWMRRIQPALWQTRCRKGAIHPNRAVPRGSADMSCSPCAEFGNGGTIPACCLRGPFGVSFLMSASPGSTTRASARDERPTAVVSALRDQAPAEVPKRDAQALSLRWHLAGCLARCVAGACFGGKGTASVLVATAKAAAPHVSVTWSKRRRLALPALARGRDPNGELRSAQR